jgi:hypothetical protein
MVNTKTIAAEYRLAHWAAIMKERKESGQSIKAYCESVGIHVNVYHYWQRKLREAACENMLPVEVKEHKNGVVPSGWAACEITETKSGGNNSVVIEVGKFKLTVGDANDMELFAKVCHTLMSIC